jgi:DNA processing protein
LSVVWPRLPSEYGLRVTSDIVKLCATYWITTISWWADGIDERLHRESLTYHVPTIVVLWWWIWRFLQSSHRRQLIHDIISNWWLILSEYKIFSKPEKYTFPQRNRIIAGLSDNLIVPEAWLKSGSLITASNAFKFGVNVWTVPHSIYSSTSIWTYSLIKSQQAQFILHLNDRFAERYSLQSRPMLTDSLIQSLLPDQLIVYQAVITCVGISVNDLQRMTWFDLQQLLSITLILELEWLIVCDYEWNYAKK